MTQRSLSSSLAEIGIEFGRRQLVGLISGAISGLIFAYVFPTVYAPVVGTLMDQVQQCTGCWRDTVNKYLMTVLTFAISFVVGIAVSRSTRFIR